MAAALPPAEFYIDKQDSKYLGYPPTSFENMHPFGITNIHYNYYKINQAAERT